MDIDKIRMLPDTTTDAPRPSPPQTRSPPVIASHWLASSDKSHSSAPDPEPGVLHFYYDIMEMVVAMGGYQYIVFLIDEYSRLVFYDFIKPSNRAYDRAVHVYGVLATWVTKLSVRE